MKKVILLTLAFVVLAAGASFAGISGSKHDLVNGNGAVTSSDPNAQICVFCHTPHAGNTGIPAPLWNRAANATTWANTNQYSSSTMNGTSTSTGAISQACLSCHDGNVGDEVLLNAPGSGGLNTSIAGDLNNSGVFGSVANLNDAAGLTNDHPIGLNMTTISADDTGIYSAPQSSALRLFSGLVECATCHDVHNALGIEPLLAETNDASAMCLDCHNK